VSQGEIPGWFARAQVFMFPTLADVWGVVANEACLAGVPVLVSPQAGVADELVRDGINGFVLPLDLDTWSSAATRLLTDGPLHQRMSLAARKAVKPYSFKNAAAGIVDATRHAFEGRPVVPSSTFPRRQRVVCIQRRLTHYRVPLFNALKADLAMRGIDFVLVHGNPAPSELKKNDSGELAWAQFVPCTYLAGERICWQNPGKLIDSADLVIVTQENKLVFNLLALVRPRAYRLAFWGHGRNMQTSTSYSLRERFKRWTTQKVNRWFAYTTLSLHTVQTTGFPADGTTDVQNSIDLRRLGGDCQSITDAEIATLRKQLDLGDGPLGLFVGSLYPDKRLGFLLQATQALAETLPGFRMIIVGSGPEQDDMADAAMRLPWLRFVGSKVGRDKALYLRAATLMLNPGLVGLGILDAFAAGLPMVTTDCDLHSPEIAYLRHGENGLMTADTLPAFVEACTDLLSDAGKRLQMAAAARADADQYTVQNMARRFGDGIVSALRGATH
jgi:glycosyltransferase involved in cell wall biosynthesis